MLQNHALPDSAIMHVEALSFFNIIRRIYTTHANDKPKAHALLFEHLRKYGDPLRMSFYVDGTPALEKKETRLERNDKQVMALKSANVAVETFSNRLSQGKPLTKQAFKEVENSLCGGFK
jgi:hypothetical protein